MTGDRSVIQSLRGTPLTNDRGSFLLSRTANYFEDRFLAFAWLSIGYSPPGGKFSVDEINAMSRERLGWTVFGYWYFFDEPDAPELLNHNVGLHKFTIQIILHPFMYTR